MSDLLHQPGAPKLLIGTRLGLGMKNRAWFEHRLALFSAITAPSLLAQEDQGFEWAVFVSLDLPEDIRRSLEETLAPFEGRAFLHTRPGVRISTSLAALAEGRSLVDAKGWFLTGRIDDDDAWDVRTVGEVRKRMADHLARPAGGRGVGLTFENGLVWVMYEMHEVKRLSNEPRPAPLAATIRRYQYPFHSMSGFVCSRLSDGITAYSDKHARLPDLLEGRGMAVEVIAAERPMWLYCRHKQAGSSIGRATSEEVDLNLADLARMFGIDESRTRQYLAAADTYGYTRFSPMRDQGKYWAPLSELQREIDAGEAGPERLAELEAERARLINLCERASERLVAPPGEIPDP